MMQQLAAPAKWPRLWPQIGVNGCKVNALPVAGVVLCLLGLVGCTSASPHAVTWAASSSGAVLSRPTAGGPSSAAVPHVVTPSPVPTSAASTGLSDTPLGVQAGWVIAENAKPGNPDWAIPAGLTGAAISGYADTTQAVAGQRVRLYVSTSAPWFSVRAYRMGYYGGADARLVWASAQMQGLNQNPCPLTAGVNMVSCSWTPSLTVSIGTQFPPGDYLFKLLAVSGQQSYVPLTIADPGSHATYLVQNSIMSWQAWNNYGGYDMYGGTPGKSPRYADRSRVLSFDRPYAYGGGAADFLGNELPLVEFLEQHGLDVSYVSDIAVNDDPSLILAHKVFLSLGHDECWAMAQRNGISQAITRGVNVVFFGASPILRHVRMQAGLTGPDREMVDYRVPNQDPIYRTDPKDATGNTWAEPPADAPPSQITGDTYSGYGINAPMVISDASAWVFTGTGLRNGSSLPHVVRSDYDRYVRNHFTPRNVQVLTASPVVTSSGAHGIANMTYYTNPASNAGVLATGTNAWIASMAPCPSGTTPCPASVVQAMTTNILRVFGAGPAGLTEPSK